MDLNLKKKVKKAGSSLGVIFTRPDRDVYGIEYGDVVSVKVIKKNKGGSIE